MVTRRRDDGTLESRLSIRDYVALIGLGLTAASVVLVPLVLWGLNVTSRVQRLEDRGYVGSGAAERLRLVEVEVAELREAMVRQTTLLEAIADDVSDIKSRGGG